jgi:NADH-quinone oxidoreductase subunit A
LSRYWAQEVLTSGCETHNIHHVFKILRRDGVTTMGDNYFLRYLPLLVHLAMVVGMAAVIVLLSWFVGRHKPNKAKMSPYECGMQPTGEARRHFSVKFYLVAMMFILFDVEAVFLYPWAILLRELKVFGLYEMFVYLGVVLVGFVYIWKKGVLDWSKAKERETL